MINKFLKKKNGVHASLVKLSKKQSKLHLPLFISRINAALTTLSFQQCSPGLYTALICAAIIWFRLHDYVNAASVNSWFGIIVLITLFRATLIKLYFLHGIPAKIKTWRYLFIIGSALGGLSWGLISFVLMRYISSSDQILVLMIFAGITAGAVAFISTILLAVNAYLILALVPLALYFAFISPTPDYLTAVTVCIYLVFLLMQAKKVHEMLQNGLLLQFKLNEAKNQMEQTATHDPLTKVANRHLFNVNLEKALENAKKTNSKVALLYLDLNKFKSINDIYGHHVGDKVLLTFIERLKTLFKKEDMIARLGGDEFTVTIDTFTNHNNAENIAKEIYSVLEAPAFIDNQKINIRASLGISIYPTDGLDKETLLRVADHKMYNVKNKGG